MLSVLNKPTINNREVINYSVLKDTRNVSHRTSLISGDYYVAVDGPPLQPENPAIARFGRYIRNNSQSLENTLSRSVENARFVLVGESHIRDNALRVAFTSAILSRLNGEVGRRGQTLIVALELHHGFQGAINNLNLRESNDVLRRRLREVTGFNENHQSESYIDMIINLRRAGVRVVCIDDLSPDETHPIFDGRYTEGRDVFMFDQITRLINENRNARILFFGGAHHTSRSNASHVWSPRRYRTLGSLLSARFGEDSIISFRSTDQYIDFGGEFVRDSKLPRVRDLIPQSQRGIVVVPENRELFRTQRYAHDYIIVNSVNEEYDRR